MPEVIRSRPYSTEMACERCVFGRGQHADFCRYYLTGQVTFEMLEIIRRKQSPGSEYFARMDFPVKELMDA